MRTGFPPQCQVSRWRKSSPLAVKHDQGLLSFSQMCSTTKFPNNFETMVLFMDSKTSMEYFHKFSISVSHGGVGHFKVCLEVVDDDMNLIGHV